MKLKWIWPAMACLLWGCASHYYKNDGDHVGIYLEAPQSRSVMLVASFNSYAPLRAERAGRGIWVVDVPTDTSFSYFYLVDGTPTVPPCEMTERDDFGRENCIFTPTP
jgi:1,4-alpha-glucan branching enzyme